MPLAPGWFSTTTDWPHMSESFCATIRVKASEALPVDSGTMILTAFVGQLSAATNGDSKAKTTAVAKAEKRVMLAPVACAAGRPGASARIARTKSEYYNASDIR